MAHVTFIHGIANKPSADVLIGEWERALADDGGVDLGAEGVTTSMVYWADVLYPEALPGILESFDEGAAIESVDMDWQSQAAGSERAWVDSLARRLDVDKTASDANAEGVSPGEEGFERIPLPDIVKVPLMRGLLRDVHHYLFNVAHEPRPGEHYLVRDEVRRRTVDALCEGAAGSPPHIVVSHSMGTVIAYDCLKRVGETPPIDGLVTIGSPLGLDEIPDRLRPEWNKADGFPVERLRGRWVNVFDHFDPVVGPTPHLRFWYKRDGTEAVNDINEQNWGRWRHDITKYLHGKQLREELADLLGI